MEKREITLGAVQEMLRDIIEETYGNVKILGYAFSPNDILESCNKTAYKEVLLNFYDCIRKEYHCRELEK